MALLSPGSEIQEINASLVSARVGTSAAVFVGDFVKGPVDEMTAIGTPNDYVTIFGEPNPKIMNQWYQGYNFLGYGAGFAYITRVVGPTALNSTAEIETIGGNPIVPVPQLIKNDADWDVISLGGIVFGKDETNEVRVDALATGLIFDNTDPVNPTLINNTGAPITLSDGIIYTVGAMKFTKTTEEIILDGASYIIVEGLMPLADDMSSKLKFFARNPGVWGDKLEVAIANASDFGTATPSQAFSGVVVDDQFEYNPSVNEIAVLISYAGVVAESYIVSLDETAVDYANKSTYIENIINERSNLVYVKDNQTVETVASKLYSKNGVIVDETVKFVGGDNGTATQAEIIAGYDLYSNVDEIDVDIIIGNEIANDAAINLAELRKDCIAYIGARFEDCVGKTAVNATKAIVDYTKGEMNVNSIYTAFYGNYKFQFDKFTGKNVWLNLAGDVAGIRAQTNELQNPWTASAGIQRGGVKNVKKFAFIPNGAQRDLLYQNKTNIVTSFPGSGNVIWGNKTFTSVPSAFDRVTTRALFNYLERSVYKTSKAFTFEINDNFTRNRFLSAIVPFLNTVQSNRGIEEYRAICDETNNTAAVRERNEFVADIVIKPTYIAEFITLKFTAVNASTNIDTVIA